MAWIAWHIARLQDARAASLAGTDQIWITDGWHGRFGLADDPANHGRGHSDEDVDAVRPVSVQALQDYATATSDFLREQLEHQRETVR